MDCAREKLNLEQWLPCSVWYIDNITKNHYVANHLFWLVCLFWHNAFQQKPVDPWSRFFFFFTTNPNLWEWPLGDPEQKRLPHIWINTNVISVFSLSLSVFLQMAGPPVIRWDVCKVLLLFQERSQWLCVDSRSAPAAAGRFFTSASSALTPFICGYLSSCLPFCSLSLCLQWRCLPGGVHLIRAASCRSPAQYSDILPVLCAVSSTQLQYIT